MIPTASDYPWSVHYSPPSGGANEAMILVALRGDEECERFVFYDYLEIGRHGVSRSGRAGLLQIEDPTVSSRHCVITRTADGSCLVRDLSRNGTRVDGRRLVHNQETEFRVGETLRLGVKAAFRLEAPPEVSDVLDGGADGQTDVLQEWSLVTVLVGDIRHYTSLTQGQAAVDVVHSVGNVFTVLEREVERHGGTVKEFQGDAMLAFWEAGTGPQDSVEQACRAAIHLNRRARELADDPSVWSVKEFPLEMDWALSTGLVAMEGSPGHAGGLMMVGEPMVRAFRMEKLAGPDTGSILACEATRDMVGPGGTFEDLGEHHLAGFEEPERIFALRSVGEDLVCE